jgi:hypothetical protein
VNVQRRLRKASRPTAALLAVAFALVNAAAARVAIAQPAPPASAAAANESRKAFMDAEKEARAKHWDAAAERYRQSNTAMPTPQALTGLANAQYQLGQAVDAYHSYEDLLKTYGDKLGPAKAAAEARLKELAGKTGLLGVNVNETGADIAIDGKAFGQSPLAAPVRLAAGTHSIKVTKAGFTPFEKSLELQGGQTQTAEATLAKEATKGTVSVREKAGQAVRVLVDGLDVGSAPWTGELDPGSHEVTVRGAGVAAMPQKIDVQKGAKQDLEFAAVAATARLEVKTSDAKGIIFLDGKPVAEGQFRGDIPAGAHLLEVKREGFDTYAKQIDLGDKQTYAETVTLTRPGGDAVGPAVEGERLLQGIYGGFGLTGVYLASGLGSELESRCSALGASKCDTPSSYGAGTFGYVGYTWNPIGFEVMLGGLFDGVTQRATFDGNTSSGQNPLVATPPRNERFTFIRFGGLGAIRARATMQNQHVRGSIAAGLGLSYKLMTMERKTTTADGTNMQDGYVPDPVSYFSPAITVDASVQLRLGQTTSIALGFLVWAENAGTSTKTPADPKRFLGGGTGTPAPISTPEYHLASDAQIFIGPYIGMQFGP